jgi:hypothetical protein
MWCGENEATCYVCGEINKHTEAISVGADGCCDLDSRPPWMLRSLLYYQIQRCPSCGYSSDDISKGHDLTIEFVKSKDYQDRIKYEEVPEKTTSFYNYAEDKALQGEYDKASWNFIYAAWICDDETASGNNTDADFYARWFRLKAFIFAARGMKKSQHLSKYQFVTFAILLDILRRGWVTDRKEHFEYALNWAKWFREQCINKPFVQYVDFQISLILQEDSECHNLSEIPDWDGSYSIPNGPHLSVDY